MKFITVFFKYMKTMIFCVYNCVHGITLHEKILLIEGNCVLKVVFLREYTLDLKLLKKN